MKWKAPNGDLSAASGVLMVVAAIGFATAAWFRSSGLDHDLRVTASAVGAMAPAAWALLPVSIFKARWERWAFALLCLGLSAILAVFLVAPQVLA